MNCARTIRRKLIGLICDCPTERSASSNPGCDAEKIAGIASTRALGWHLAWTCSAFIASAKLRGPTCRVATRAIAGRQLRRASSHQWTIAAGLTSGWARWHPPAARPRPAEIGEQWRIVRNAVRSRGTAAASTGKITAAPRKAGATTARKSAAGQTTSPTARKTATARETATAGKTPVTSRKTAASSRNITSAARKASTATRRPATSASPATSSSSATAGKQRRAIENKHRDDSRSQDKEKP